MRSINDVRKTVAIDTVAKVLNYSEGLPTDEGSDWQYWYAYDAKNCIYRKAEYKRVSEDDAKPVVFDVMDTKELKLNEIDRSSIKYSFQSITHPSIGIEAPHISPSVRLLVV